MKFKKVFLCLMSLLLIFSTVVLGEEINKIDTLLEFIAKYDYHRVFNQYVNAQHIDLKSEPINTKRNFLIKARFEDEVKDISENKINP